MKKNYFGILLGICILAMGFMAFKLYGQGAYHDELHQIINGMFLLGANPQGFLLYHGVPVLSMPYSSPLKGILYGLLVKYFLGDFSIVSVRLFGITSYVFFVFLFALKLKEYIGEKASLLACVLIFSDATLSLCVRHDWGPVAFSAILRFFLITAFFGIAYKLERKYFLYLGLFFSLSAYEKVNNVVLTIPILLFFFFYKLKNVKNYAYFFVGGLLGAVPLIFVNSYSWIRYKQLASIQSASAKNYTLHGLLDTLVSYFFTAYSQVSDFIFNKNNSYTYPDFSFNGIEAHYNFGGLASIILLLSGLYFYKKNYKTLKKHAVLFNTFAISYLLMPFACYALPANIWMHHLVIGTPFQYIAICLYLFDAFHTYRVNSRKVLSAGVLALFLCNTFSYADFLKNTYEENASQRWSRSLNALSDSVKMFGDDVFFAATSWGVGFLLYASRPKLKESTDEIFWNYDKDKFFQMISDKKAVYLVSQNMIQSSIHFNGRSLNTISTVDADLAASPEWVSCPVEEDFKKLHDITVIKFCHKAGPGALSMKQ